MSIPVYLINLPDDVRRRAHALGELRKCALLDSLVEVGAIRGADLSVDEVSRIYDATSNARRFRKPLSRGEIGCYASHLKCWERVAAADAPMALVIEDDVRIDEDILQTLQGVESSGVEFDMIKLVGRPRESVLRVVRPIGSRRLVEYFRVPSSSGAYLVSRTGARKLVARRRRFFRPVDVDLRYWWEVDSAFRMFGVHPYPVSQAGFASGLDKQTASRAGLLRKRVLRLMLQTQYLVQVTACSAGRLIRSRFAALGHRRDARP